MTGNELDTSTVSPDPPDRAEEELWLTYLNYDQSIQQAVRRLGALSQQNVEVFRSLLLEGRDRKRVKDYEAESIRRLQGKGFVGDEALQRALIVLNAEDPRYGEELKRQVAASGKPAELDQAVAAIRASIHTSYEQPADQPEPDKSASGLAETPAKDEDRESVVVPLRKEWAAPAAQVPLREEIPTPKRNLTLPLVIGAVMLVAVAGLYFLAPGLVTGNNAARVAATSPAAEPEAAATRPAAAPAAPSAPAAQSPPAETADIPDQAGKSENSQANNSQANNSQANDSQADNSQEDKTASSSPPLRPATTQPDTAGEPSAPANAAAAAPSQQDVSSTPVAGANYKVVRGDMLSHIARTVYGSSAKFRLISGRQSQPSPQA